MYFNLFFTTRSMSKKFFSERKQKKALHDTLTQAHRQQPSNFWWFVIGPFWACACKLSWTLFSPARVQPLYGVGRRESSGTGLLRGWLRDSGYPICYDLPLIATLRDCSPLFALFKTIRTNPTICYLRLFVVRYSRLFAICYLCFPDT